jgi:Xaa-Pro aminopeptidase
MADQERLQRIAAELKHAGLDAFLCTLPMNVLMLTGYWPVIGTAAAVGTREGEIWIAAPEAERDFAVLAKPHRLVTFAPGSLQQIGGLPVAAALRELLNGRSHGRVGVELGPATVPGGYSALHIYGAQLREVLMAEGHEVVPADEPLARLRAVKTGREIEFIRAACAVAAKGFTAAAATLSPGRSELDVALAARHQFSLPAANEGEHRADGFAWCMSGPNSADAGAAFARSQSRRISLGDAVLLHANSYLDGYWTDITRTFVAGDPTKEMRKLLGVIEEARAAALAAIRPGAAAKSVDAAAREVIVRSGFGDHFTHGLGHEVGFGAINANDRPRLHPASPDVLESGMVFNVEPAIYLPDRFGVRHCDMARVTDSGAEVLTPWLPHEQLHPAAA